MKDKCCIYGDEDVKNTQTVAFIAGKIKESDFMFSIILLTMMNSQNKKNQVAMQGYHVATAMELLCVILNLNDNREFFVCQLGHQTLGKLESVLSVCASKSLQQNFDSVINAFPNKQDVVIKIIMETMNLFNDRVKKIMCQKTYTFDVRESNNAESDIARWYIKEGNELMDTFMNTIMVSQDTLNDYVNARYFIISELSFVLGYVMGGGSKKDTDRIRRMARNFSLIYKISLDFESIESDIQESANSQTPCRNYVVNRGIQDAYEDFMRCKQRFIEDSMMIDVYTSTLREIIDLIEVKIDAVIDQTSPDLKSNI